MFFIIKSLIDAKEICSCRNEGFKFDTVFYLRTDNLIELNSAKVKVFHKNTNYETVIDSAYVICEKYSLKEKTNNIDEIKFSKPISTNSDWKIILSNKKEITITEIETDINCYYNMFGKHCKCEIVSARINGVKNEKDNSIQSF